MALMFRSVLQSGGGAELIVTCDSEFAGATISCSDGTTTLNKTCPVSSPYEVTFKIPNSGDWTISATVSGTTYTSDPISVDLDYETDLEFGFNWKRWVDTAQYLDSTDYSTLSDLLADEEALRELCLEHACVDYLCQSADVNANLTTIIGTDLFAKWVNNSDYALDNMIANEAIKDAMDEADKYEYGEYCLMPQVPIMTSNTAPYGVITSKEYLTDYDPYKGFNRNTTNHFIPQNTLGHTTWFQYQSLFAFKPSKLVITFPASASSGFTATLKASNDGTNYTPIKTFTIDNKPATVSVETINLDVSIAYTYWYFDITSVTDSSKWIRLADIQFYAYAPKGNVPVMTGNSAPYGEVSASSTLTYQGTTYSPYYVFNDNMGITWCPNNQVNGAWIQYKFTNPIEVRRLSILAQISQYTNQFVKTFKVQYSDNGTNYSDVENNGEAIIYTCEYTDGKQLFDIPSMGYHIYWRVYCLTNYGHSSQVRVGKLQFYGRELSVSVPKMDTNTTPYGEASADSVYQDNYAYKAFDNNPSTYWHCDGGLNNYWLQYAFTTPTVIKKFMYSSRNTASRIPSSLILQGSDDGLLFTDIKTVTPSQTTSDTNLQPFDCSENETPYKVIRLKMVLPSSNYTDVITLQFYGLDYSEKEFEVGTTKKWLYDHGVELVDMDLTGYSEYHASVVDVDGINNADNIELSVPAGDYKCLIGTQEKVDFTPYTYLMGKYRFKSIAGNAQLKIVGVKQDDNSASSTISLSELYASSNAQSAIDVSSINALDYPIFRTYGYTVGVGNLAQDFEVYELWLE